jgi:hypothetical protein
MRPIHLSRKRRALRMSREPEPTAATAAVPPLTDGAITPQQAELADILGEITHLTGRGCIWADDVSDE